MGIRDIAKKIGQSRAAGGGNYVKDGRGTGIVKVLKHEDAYKGEIFVAEILVESSEATEREKDGTPVQPNAVGSSFSFVQLFEEYPDTAFGNTKAFILALMGETDESLAAAAKETVAEMMKKGSKATAEEIDKWDADAEFAAAYQRLTSSQNPARGMRIRWETYRKSSKRTGKVLTIPRWETVEQTAEQIAETRAKLG